MVEKLPRVVYITWVHEQINGIIRFCVPPPPTPPTSQYTPPFALISRSYYPIKIRVRVTVQSDCEPNQSRGVWEGVAGPTILIKSPPPPRASKETQKKPKE